jgi:hypothetical protein
MTFNILTAVKMATAIFCVVTPRGISEEHTASIFRAEDGSSTVFGNVFTPPPHLQVYTALLPRRWES